MLTGNIDAFGGVDMTGPTKADGRLTAQHSIDALAAWLLQSAGTGVGGDAVVGSIITTWQDVDAALTPIIGPRGVAALFNRSLQLASLLQPVLHGIEAATPTTMDLSPLKLRLAGQSPTDAAATGAAMLHTFHQLLGTLIGASLTEQLLRRVWPPLLNHTPQDSAP